MSNGVFRPLWDEGDAEARRLAAPRVHALRGAVVEALWGDYDPDLCDLLRRVDNILLWMCWQSEEVSEDLEQWVTELLWLAAMKREAA